MIIKKTTTSTIVSLVLIVVFGLAGVFAFSQQALASYGDSLLYWGSRGEYVKNLQRDLTSLGYDTYGIDGIFGANTYNAVVNFQKAKGITVDGLVGPVTKSLLEESINNLYYVVLPGDTLNEISRKYGITVSAIMKANNLNSYMIYPGDRLFIPRNGTTATPSRSGSGYYGELVDWWTVASKVFYVGKIATVTDVDTGISYQVIRKGGTNHADCQPLTASDTAKMKQAYGGSWSWTRHAIIVEVDGRRLAASQNGMPHGGQSIYDNDFPGHFCIHFLNSRTHGTDRVDENHQAMVKKAAGL